MKRKVISAAEYDVVCGHCRRLLCYLQRAGVTAGIKRQIRRRERREAKAEMRRDDD